MLPLPPFAGRLLGAVGLTAGIRSTTDERIPAHGKGFLVVSNHREFASMLLYCGKPLNRPRGLPVTNLHESGTRLGERWGLGDGAFPSLTRSQKGKTQFFSSPLNWLQSKAGCLGFFARGRPKPMVQVKAAKPVSAHSSAVLPIWPFEGAVQDLGASCRCNRFNRRRKA